MQFKINTDATIDLTKKLKQLHKSAFPAAVLGTLNDAAFNLKMVTMPKASVDVFEKRQDNFFRANSQVIKANGFDVDTMKSTVGFKSLNGNNYAVDDLEYQEHGGLIDKKSFIPTVLARKGNSQKGLVKTNARLSAIKNMIDAKNSKGKNTKEAFVIAASIAGKGGFVLRRNTLFRIDTAPKSNLKSRVAKFKATPIYSFRKNRKAAVQATHFMEEATVATSKKMDEYYIKNGERQVNKIWK